MAVGLSAVYEIGVGGSVRPAGSWRLVAVGAVCGLALGAIARLWMRWISTEPEFSWPGTMAILVSFTIFGAAQSAAAVARRRAWRGSRLALVRGGAAVLSMGLFGAAGATMLPTVLFGSLAVWRIDVRPVGRVVFGMLALPGVVFVAGGIAADKGWSAETVGRMLLFVAIYAAIIGATWPVTAPVRDGWRPTRRFAIAAVGAVGTVGAFLAVAL